MLEHVLRRARRIRCADVVVLATTRLPADDVLAQVGTEQGALVVRGSENDVLARFDLAADRAEADVIVRITADCPLLDPRLADRMIRMLNRTNVEYASNISPPTYPDGYDVEVMTRACLHRLASDSKLDYEREHVTARAREHPSDYLQVNLRSRVDYSSLRLTVDTAMDLARVEEILAEAGTTDIGLGGVIAVLRRRPDLRLLPGGLVRDVAYLAARNAHLGVPGTKPS